MPVVSFVFLTLSLFSVIVRSTLLTALQCVVSLCRGFVATDLYLSFNRRKTDTGCDGCRRVHRKNGNTQCSP